MTKSTDEKHASGKAQKKESSPKDQEPDLRVIKLQQEFTGFILAGKQELAGTASSGKPRQAR